MDVLVPVRRLILGYILTSGNLSQLQHDPAEAEEAYNAAISLDPLSPDAHMSLAFLQARRGRTGEARKTAETALSLCAPDERAKRREEFERVLSAAIAREQPATVSQP
jgi:Tfp pilus assembly protein PilF